MATNPALDFDQPVLGIMSLDAEPADFDYGAFLQDEDVDYLAEDSSASGRSNTLADASSKTLLVQHSLAKATSPAGSSGNSPKQRLERRGHTKSRRGCFNCKRRRIKCQETRPACGHCVKTGLKCEYPSLPQVNHQIPLFSLQDMRFFQHFLFKCYPSHPLGNESVWTHEIPCLSQNYEYLMHAILGFSASDLMKHDASLVTAAMTHRVKAIKAIKRTLADVPKANSFEEGNALMATCFALTFQSVLLDDGMAEFMTFIRGIVIVAIQMYMKGSRFLFHDFIGDDQTELLKPFMEQLPLIDASWSQAAVAAIKGLEPLCTAEVERGYYELLLQMAEGLLVSSFDAYKALTRHYGWWMQLPHDKFQQVVDPNSQVFNLLATHWIAVKQIMALITETELKLAEKEPDSNGDIELGMIRWLKHLNCRVEPEYLAYNQWPLWVEARLDGDPCYFGKTR